jgi:hypothetical protein
LGIAFSTLLPVAIGLFSGWGALETMALYLLDLLLSYAVASRLHATISARQGDDGAGQRLVIAGVFFALFYGLLLWLFGMMVARPLWSDVITRYGSPGALAEALVVPLAVMAVFHVADAALALRRGSWPAGSALQLLLEPFRDAFFWVLAVAGFAGLASVLDGLLALGVALSLLLLYKLTLHAEHEGLAGPASGSGPPRRPRAGDA